MYKLQLSAEPDIEKSPKKKKFLGVLPGFMF
jgi:hypothetical protein